MPTPHSSATRAARTRSPRATRPRTLAVDIGGSGLKVLVLDPAGKPLGERLRVDTPRPATPRAVLTALRRLVAQAGRFERVSVGFPGVVRGGVVQTAPNLAPDWAGVDLARQLQASWKRPVRVTNDSGMQGAAVIRGRGVELVLTLGTGFGFALFVDGHHVPNVELAHHPFRDSRTYEDELGEPALERHGKKRWNKRLGAALALLQRTFNPDALYIGGGNAEKITFALPHNARAVPTVAGLLGGIALWRA